MFDIAIIGSGPAGVSAALTAKNRNKSILLLGSRTGSPKISKTHQINNYPGLPRVSGAELTRILMAQLDDLEIPVTEERVSAVYAMGDSFSIQAGESFYEARTVILTTGVVMGKALPGEEDLLGAGVSYCATCDASFYRNKTACIIGYGPDEEKEAAFLAEVAAKVFYFPQYKGEISLPENVEIIREAPEKIERTVDPEDPDNGITLYTKAGNAFVTHGVFVLRESIAPGQLVPGLATEGAHIVVDRNMATNLPGLYAAGDITGLPYQIAKATGEGNIAAISAASLIDAEKRNNA